MTVPEETARDLALKLRQAQQENRQLRDRWNSVKRIVLDEWKRGVKMPYSIVRPFIEGHTPAVQVEHDEDDQGAESE